MSSYVQVHFHANQTHFHKKDFAQGLVLKQRYKGTRKWPILSPCLEAVRRDVNGVTADNINFRNNPFLSGKRRKTFVESDQSLRHLWLILKGFYCLQCLYLSHRWNNIAYRSAHHRLLTRGSLENRTHYEQVSGPPDLFLTLQARRARGRYNYC